MLLGKELCFRYVHHNLLKHCICFWYMEMLCLRCHSEGSGFHSQCCLCSGVFRLHLGKFGDGEFPSILISFPPSPSLSSPLLEYLVLGVKRPWNSYNAPWGPNTNLVPLPLFLVNRKNLLFLKPLRNRTVHIPKRKLF